jgi:hypothetical protein
MRGEIEVTNMALQFNPYPILDPEQYQKPRMDFTRDISNPILQGLQTLVQMKDQRRQQQLQDLQNQRDQKVFEFQYGKDVSPGLSPAMGETPQPMIARSGQQPMTQTGQMRGFLQQGQPSIMQAWNQRKQNKNYIPPTNHVPGSLERAEQRQLANDQYAREDLSARREDTAANREWSQKMDLANLGLKQDTFDMKTELNQLKQQQAKEKEQKIRGEMRDRANLVIGKVDDAINNISGWNTGGMSGTANIPFLGQATGAKNLESTLETIKAILGFDQLAQMKTQSTAGASGLGQLSDREMRLLTAARANLEQAQTPEQLRKRLSEIKMHFNNWLMMEEGRNPYENGSGGGQPLPGNTIPTGQRKSATNPQTGERLYSDDGGQTWHR